PIVGDVKNVLSDMLAVLTENNAQLDQVALNDWWAQINEWRKRHGLRYDKDDSNGMKPQHVVERLYELTHGKAIITSDVGQHQMFAALY
ncbi:hypothetical protein K4H02_23540, partial [Mycobacterium tuberculosis]|nr:hypothetical protein [Mycobacterium tuberculosis]